MADIFDYITWRGDLEFTKSPLNPVDSIIFSQLSYLPFDDIVPGSDEKDGISIKNAAKILGDRLRIAQQLSVKSASTPVAMFKKDPVLLETLASSNRFGNCRLFGYINHIDIDLEVQISAICISTGDGSTFIVFRGTDFSFVGWKEDFNMSFCETIPAQHKAVEYLEKMAPLIKGPLRLGGHSKGGNLAIFAASFCGKRIQKRITEIYSNDAPGFHGNIINSMGFNAIRGRIHSYIPQASVVGMFLESGCKSKVVKSTKIGLLQHELYSWEVTHNDMVYVDDVTLGSRFFDKTVRGWLAGLDNKQREQYLKALYGVLVASEAKSVPELESSWLKATGRMLKSLGTMDKPTRTMLHNTLKELRRSVRKNLIELVKR